MNRYLHGMPGRIVILSDTHLGRPSCGALSARALRPLWQGASHLIINGDLAEIHHPTHWGDAARESMHLLDLCEEDSVALTLLSGNHDPFISEVRHLHLADGQVFVTHGDALHPAVAPWSPAAGRMRKAHEEALAAIEPESRGRLESRLKASQRASHVEWTQLEEEASHSTVRGMLLRPWSILQVLHYWHVFPKLASSFVQEHAPQARFAILGHTHRPGIWTINNRVLINTGAFGFPGQPRAVCLEGNRLTVWPIHLREKLYEFGREPLAEFQLDSAMHHEGPDPSALKTRPGRARPKIAAI